MMHEFTDLSFIHGIMLGAFLCFVVIRKYEIDIRKKGD